VDAAEEALGDEVDDGFGRRFDGRVEGALGDDGEAAGVGCWGRRGWQVVLGALVLGEVGFQAAVGVAAKDVGAAAGVLALEDAEGDEVVNVVVGGRVVVVHENGGHVGVAEGALGFLVGEQVVDGS
jgi:hypothetical protein